MVPNQEKTVWVTHNTTAEYGCTYDEKGKRM